jgi:hypothetical protein
MGDANTGRGYGHLLYGLSPEEQKKYITKQSDPDILKRDGFEKVFERFLNAEPPAYKALREAYKVADEKQKASWKDFDPYKVRPEGMFDVSRTVYYPGGGYHIPAFENPYVLPTAQQIADREASSKAFKDLYAFNDSGSYPSPTPTPDIKPFEKLITSQESNAEEKEEPKKEKTFEELLNKLNKSQEQEEPRRDARGNIIPQAEEEEPTRYPRGRGMFQEDEEPIRRDVFGRGTSTFGDYTPQEQDQPRDAFGRISALNSNEEEAVQPIPKTKAPDFLEAYKNAIETNSTNNKNEDIAAVYKPSTPTTETWMEKLEKDYERNKNKPVPTNIPYRRGTGLGDHMGADASETIDAFGRGMLQEEPTSYPSGRGIFQEDEQPIDAFGRRRSGFDPSEYYA